MSPLSAHRIGRLTWRVQATSTPAALLQRQRLRDDWEDVLLPALERVFDRFAAGGEVLRIPKLTLRVAGDGCTAAELAFRVEEQLTAALAGLVRGREFHRDRERDDSADHGGVIQLTAAAYRRDQLLAYLHSGRMDWSACVATDGELLNWLQLEAEAFATEPAALEDMRVGPLQVRSISWFRLLQLLATASRERLLQRVPEPLAELVAWIRDASVGDYWRLRAIAVLVALRDDVWSDLVEQSVHEHLAAQHFPPAIAAILQNRLAEDAQFRQDSREPSAELVVDQASSVPAAATDRHAHFDAAEESASGAGEASPRPAAAPRDRVPLTREGAAQHVSRAAAEAGIDRAGRTSVTLASRIGMPEAFDPVMIHSVMTAVSAADARPGRLAQDAGLILLHPFIGQFFKAVGIYSSHDQRLRGAELPRAAALLHWIASGHEAVFEFELVLCKLLVGLVPDDPLPVGEGLLSDADCEEGRAMLAAVIDHWSILRGTSIDGLRTSFLQRRGMLRDDANGWRLRMEPESFDLLLGQLPWEISVVKLPWMTRALFTEWPTPG